MGTMRGWMVVLAMAFAPVACVRERVVYVVKEVPGPAASCSCTRVEATCPPPAPVARTCGQLRLDRESLRAHGKGDRHPDVLAVEAKLAECKDSAPTQADCVGIRAELTELKNRGYGPMHPEVRATQAELDLCPKPGP
jgi:hypothetical protein